MSIANIAMIFKKKKKWAPQNHLKRRIQRSPWQDMKQHAKYNDPMGNYNALSSFYQMIVITSIHFTILPLAFYLDYKPFSFGWGSWRLSGICTSCHAGDYMPLQ